MTVLTRSQFIDHFRKLGIDGTDPLCPLWIPEDGNITCHWFVRISPSVLYTQWKYYDWCNQALQGHVRCFSSDSDNQEEWWGFTHEQDVTAWMLKWAYD